MRDPLTIHILLACFFLASSVLPSESYSSDNIKTQHKPAYVPGELLVKFKPSVRRKAAEFYRAQLGVISKRTFQRIGVQQIQIPEDMSVEEALEIYRNDPSVEYAEPNYYRYLMKTPNDSFFLDYQWGLNNTGQDGGTLDADVDAPEAWEITTGSSSVIIAVIDTGVDYNHPDLANNIWINRREINDNLIDDDNNGYVDDYNGWDFGDNDNDPFPDPFPHPTDPYDQSGHGTHVAGIIAAEGNNSKGITGVSWHSKIMVLKFMNSEGRLSVDNEVEALEYARRMGAHIINLSIGGFGYSKSEKEAIDASSAVVVCAAGNENSNNDVTPVYPASYSSNNIISVAASDQNDELSNLSNYGSSSVDVAAPGVNILSTWPVTNYNYGSGTSMATAFVSGIAALVKSKNASWSNLNVKAAIISSVDEPSLSGKVLSKGRVNAANALQVTISTSSNTGGGGGGGGGGGCFIATAAYGSPLEPHVKILVEFRNRYLLASSIGRYFVKLYYSCSPTVAQFILQHGTLKVLVRCFLLPIVIVINAVIFYGMTISITGFGLSSAMICYLFILNRRRRIRNDPFFQT